MGDLKLPPGAVLESDPSQMKLPPGASLETPERSTWDSLKHGMSEFVNQLNPRTMIKGMAQIANDPVGKYTEDAAVRQKILDKAHESFGKGDYAEGAAHALYSMIPFMGQNLERSGEQFKSGDVSGGLGSSLGQGVAMALPAKIPAMIEGAGGLGEALQKTATSVDPDLVGIVSPRAANALRTAQKVGKAVSKYTNKEPIAPKVGGEPDATSENVPNAGEEWFKQPPDATTGNKPYAGEDYNKFKAEPDATSPKQDYAGENWSKKPTAIAQVAKPDVDTAAYMQAVKENGGKIDASVSGRALEIKKSWAAQSPKAQASIPTPATVEPSPSSEAYQEAPTPEGTRVPGENEDLTNLLTKSVEKAKAPEYDDATIAEARRQLTEQGYDPDHIELALKSLTGKAAPEPTVAPRARVEQQMGMSVDEQFRNHPAGPQPPFPHEAYEKALAGSDAIKNRLSSLKGVKVPRQADLTPEEIGALMRKFHGMRTQF